MPVTISAREIARMRESVKPVEARTGESRYAQLKSLSDEKVKSWPNTLEATRKKKENWKKEKLEEEERKRVEIDKEEAAIQAKRREESISRAKRILYEETDKMKLLKSKMLCSDVFYDRKFQIEEKKEAKKREREEKAQFDRHLKEQMKIAEAREKKIHEAIQLKATTIARAQKVQLDEFRERRAEKAERMKYEGELVLKRAIADAEEDARLLKVKEKESKEEMRKILFANEELKVLKQKLADEEIRQDQKRKDVVQRQEYIAKERKRLEKMRFEARQTSKQKLIDAAAAELSQRINNESSRIERQVEEMRLREEKLEEEKLHFIQIQKAAIDESRTQQLLAKQKRIQEEQAQVDDMVLAWQAKNFEIEQEEADDLHDRLEQNVSMRQFQQKQILEQKEARRKLREQDLLEDQQQKAKLQADSDTFQRTAQEKISLYKQQGKPTFPLEQARRAKDITILPTM